MITSYESLLQQLDRFIRKYYLSKILKGTLLFTAGVVSLYILLSVGEFTFYFPSWFKWLLVISFFSITLAALFGWIIYPLSKYLKIGQSLSHEQAAEIIGSHFTEVQDKLLNILQLKSDRAASGSTELAEAGIQQKIQQISWVPFSNAIDLGENKKFLRYTVPPLILLLSIILLAPNVLTESNARLSQPSKTFFKPAPFTISIDPKQLQVSQFTDTDIFIKVKGKMLPDKMEWIQNGLSFPVKKIDANTFSYTVLNIENDIDFRISAHNHISDEYHMKVLKKPIVSSMQIKLNYPKYTGLKSETIKNTGDITVPAGTRVEWILSAENTEKLSVKFEGEETVFLKKEQSKYNLSKKILKETNYKLYAFNENSGLGDSVLYSISVIEDELPNIQVSQVTDSSQLEYLFFMGNTSDDYGISKITFHISSKNEKGQVTETIRENIKISPSKWADFTHHFALSGLNLKSGERAEYFFTVWDNDAVHGSKSTRSNTFVYTVPDKDRLKEIESDNNENIKSALQSANREAQSLAQDLQTLKEKILTKKNLTWEDKRETEDLLKKHEKLKNELQDIKSKYDENLKNQDLFKNLEEDILEKQEMLNQIMEELLSPELQELMSELQELMEKLQKSDMFDKLEDMEMNNRQLNRELDKILELFKKLEFEQKASEIAQQLEELAQKQQELMGQKDASEQEKLNQEFDELKKDLEKLEKLNEEQKKKLNLNQTGQQAEEIRENMQQAKENLEENQTAPAKKQQQKAGEGMQQMAQNIRGQMQQMQMEQHMEDINTIRRLLSNLLNLSMEQEELMLKVKKTHETDVKYFKLIQEQQRLDEKSILIEDSLTALGKRVFQLETFITDELYKLKRDLKKSTRLLDEKKRGPATAAQQYAMTSANNLALMLSETMNQMQLQMPNMAGAGSCDNPDGNNPSVPTPGELKQLQEELGHELGEMGQQLKEGKSGKEVNKQLAEMAQRQATIREALRKMREEMSQKQKKESDIDRIIDDLDKIEKDIVNKKITEQTLLRQKNIETKMLELEKATREQGDKDDRTANTGKDLPKSTPKELEEFIKNRKNNLNTLKYLPPELKPFYKRLVNSYNSK